MLAGRIVAGGRIQGILKPLHIGGDLGHLRQIDKFRLLADKGRTVTGTEPAGLAGIAGIRLQQEAAGTLHRHLGAILERGDAGIQQRLLGSSDISGLVVHPAGGLILGQLRLGDVHPFLVDLYLFHQHIQAAVFLIAAGNIGDIQLHRAEGYRRIPAQLLEQRIRHRIGQAGAVGVLAVMEHIIGDQAPAFRLTGAVHQLGLLI